MKATKKLFGVLFALAMMLCLSVTAFAEGKTSVDEGPVTEVTLTKTYKLGNGNMSANSPAEDFSYTVTNLSVTDAAEGITKENMPEIQGGTIHFNEGAATSEGGKGTLTITLPNDYTSVGIYTYLISETQGNTAGVLYDSADVTMKVTVVNKDGGTGFETYVALYKNGEKITAEEAFTNTYSAGNLTVSKTVEGLLGDKDKAFAFAIKLDPSENVKYMESYAISGGSEGSAQSIAVDSVPVTVYLKHGESFTINNLPYGVEYTVTEHTYEDYSTTSTNDEGTITEMSHTASFVNTKGGEGFTPDTGITLDSMPYVLVLACVAIAGVGMIARKRRIHD